MKRVFMLSSQLMFSRGVENLLGGQATVEIVGRASDAIHALKRIRELQPDVVILDSKDLASVSSRIVASILKEVPAARVVFLNLSDDRIRVYHGEQRTARSVDDLLEVINQDSPRELGPISTQEWLSFAAERAQVYGFLAAVFSSTVDEQLIENLGASHLKLIGVLEQDNDLTGDLREGICALERFQREVSNRSPAAIKAALAEEYARLLQASQPEDRLIYACETAYASAGTPGADSIRAALKRAYAEGGLSLPANTLMPPDFIGCELDFMRQLCTSECAAWSESDRRTALNYQGLEHTFLRDHLMCWVPRFCEALLMQTKLDFYRGIACLTKGFILNEGYRVTELMEWIGAAGDEPTSS